MSAIVVGIGDCRYAERGDVLVTYALGSCIAVSAHDSAAGVGGLLHIMLPDSTIDPVRSRETPYKFADTGLPLLLDRLGRMGGQKRRLQIRLAGGAQMMDAAGVFDIGKRNYQAVRKLLWKAGLLVQGEAVGGFVSRTVRLDVSTGRFFLKEGGGPEVEMPVGGIVRPGPRKEN